MQWAKRSFFGFCSPIAIMGAGAVSGLQSFRCSTYPHPGAQSEAPLDPNFAPVLLAKRAYHEAAKDCDASLNIDDSLVRQFFLRTSERCIHGRWRLRVQGHFDAQCMGFQVSHSKTKHAQSSCGLIRRDFISMPRLRGTAVAARYLRGIAQAAAVVRMPQAYPGSGHTNST